MIVFGGIFGRILSDRKRLAQDEIRAQRLAQLGPSYEGERIDAIHRFAAREAPLWKCQRVFEYTANGRLVDGPSEPPELYSLAEAARFVGVTTGKLRQILGNKEAPAIIAPSRSTQEPTQLWPEQWLVAVRKLIASGDIEVRRSSLTKAKLGARLCSPRHRLTADQNRETEQFRKVCPLDFVMW